MGKRLNVTLSDENYDCVKLAAAVNSESMARFINDLIQKYRLENAVELARAAAEMIK